ncbi:MAG: peptide-methionine (S)-S-oxide reductase MsrA [Chthoniobacterales bacterium]|nr:peptide-methionine (S)-S-oxide reductase MsrA [Chthoniobacterales bacterium]
MSEEACIVLGGGCCWCTEAVFQQMKGAIGVEMGFAGGLTEYPTYQDVCSGTTGHAEVVKILYDVNTISFDQVLDFFWSIHDPTSIHRQGPDVGEQYRSLILTVTAEQQLLATASKARIQKAFQQPVVTEIKPLEAFYPIPTHRQNYYWNHPDDPYCRNVITPKLKKLKLKYITIH